MRLLLSIMLLLPTVAQSQSGHWSTNGGDVVGVSTTTPAPRFPGSPGQLLQERYSGNPVRAVETVGCPNDKCIETYNPSPVQLPDGDICFVYKGTANLYLACSSDGESFTDQCSGNTIQSGSVGPLLLVEEDGTAHLFGASSCDGNSNRCVRKAVGSVDDLCTWGATVDVLDEVVDVVPNISDTDITVLTAGAVVKRGSTWYMYFYWEGNVTDGVGYATSTNLTNWTWQGNLTSSLQHYLASASDPMIVSDVFRMPGSPSGNNAAYYMVFVEGDSSDTHRFSQLAVSGDLTTWTRVDEIFVNVFDDTLADEWAQSARVLKKSEGDYAEALPVDGRIPVYWSGNNTTNKSQSLLLYLYPVVSSGESPVTRQVTLDYDNEQTTTSTSSTNHLSHKFTANMQDLVGATCRYHAQLRKAGGGTAHSEVEAQSAAGTPVAIAKSAVSTTSSSTVHVVSDFFEVPETPEIVAFRVRLYISGGGSEAGLQASGISCY